jgi:hypothetical protein
MLICVDFTGHGDFGLHTFDCPVCNYSQIVCAKRREVIGIGA